MALIRQHNVFTQYVNLGSWLKTLITIAKIMVKFLDDVLDITIANHNLKNGFQKYMCS